MWIAIGIIGGLVGLVALMAVIGLFLRPDHVSTRSAVITAPPEKVWAALIDVESQPRWRKDLKKVHVLPHEGGNRQFREHGGQGKIRYVVDEERAPTATEPGKLVTRIADEDLPFGGKWIITVERDAGGSKVTVTEDGFVKNPVFRFLSKTVFSLSATQETWLAELGAHLDGGGARPEV